MKRDTVKPTPLGQRRTRQREWVQHVIHEAGGPLTVQEIHALVKQHMPRTGIATIYRTVKLLLDHKLIKAVTLPTGETRYENSDLGHHHHFQCRRCDKVFDIDHCPVTLPPGAELPGGYVLIDHEITMYGLCPKCR